MGGRAASDPGRWTALAAALAVALGAACATIEAPTGGPEDRRPPRLVAAWPESGAVGLRGVQELRLTFTEKVDPRPAARLLRLYPPLEVARTSWQGRRTARVVLAAPVPPDTVIVVELPPGLPDRHRVPAPHGRVWAFATGDSLPPGEIAGSLASGGKALPTGVIELLPAASDSGDWHRRPVLRRAETDSLGRFRLPWLPVPGGPWLLRAFADANADRRAGEGEAQRLLPDTLRLARATPRLTLAPDTLYAPNTPGSVVGAIDSTTPWAGPLYGYVAPIAETDSGWVPEPTGLRAPGQRAVKRGVSTTWDQAGPGLVRLILFVDLDGDSLFSAATLPPDTLGRWLEPHALVDSLTVEPGLPTRFRAPRFPATLTPWTEARRDSARAAPDSARDR